MKIPILLLSIIAMLGCRPTPQISKIDQSKIATDQLQSEVNRLIKAADVTGLAISIFNKNQIVFQEAFGFSNIEKQDSLEIDQIFYAASFSKAVFGYIVANLVADGVIDLDKPLQSYMDVPIPEIPVKKEWRSYKNLAEDKRYEQITARMCLSHTTGFPNWRWLSKVGDFEPEGKIQFYFDPGTRYSYSGEGMKLLQYVIEHITGKGLEELAREIVFDPLDMNMTSYVWQERFETKYCNGHSTEQKVIPKDTEDEAGAAGSMETTMPDYAKFVQHILRLTDQNSPITELMFKPNVRIRSKAQFGPLAWEDDDKNEEIDLRYGLGWGLLTTPYGFGAFKEGHGEGFQHYSIIFPEQQSGIILMSNSDNAESIFKELLEIGIGDVWTPWKWERYIPYNLQE